MSTTDKEAESTTETEEALYTIAGDRNLIRQEGIISEVDLRLDVARNMTRTIDGEESISLAEKSIHSRGTYNISRASRTRNVQGKYERRIIWDDNFTVHNGYITEIVYGGVEEIAQMEMQVIIAGGYAKLVAGAVLHIGVWTDSLVWGAWIEVDTLRLEISSLMIKSYMTSVNVAGMYSIMARRVIDDFGNRNENSVVYKETIGQRMKLGTPGSVTENNT